MRLRGTSQITSRVVLGIVLGCITFSTGKTVHGLNAGKLTASPTYLLLISGDTGKSLSNSIQGTLTIYQRDQRSNPHTLNFVFKEMESGNIQLDISTGKQGKILPGLYFLGRTIEHRGKGSDTSNAVPKDGNTFSIDDEICHSKAHDKTIKRLTIVFGDGGSASKASVTVHVHSEPQVQALLQAANSVACEPTSQKIGFVPIFVTERSDGVLQDLQIQLFTEVASGEPDKGFRDAPIEKLTEKILYLRGVWKAPQHSDTAVPSPPRNLRVY
jgi:hypothetical protein